MVTRQAPFSTFPRNPALGRVNRPIYGVLVLRLRILRRYFPREKLARGGACVTWLVTSRRRGMTGSPSAAAILCCCRWRKDVPPPFLNSELLATTACRRPHSHSLPKMDTQPLWQHAVLYQPVLISSVFASNQNAFYCPRPCQATRVPHPHA